MRTNPEGAFPFKEQCLSVVLVMVLVTEPNSPSPHRVPTLSSCSTDTPRMSLLWR